MTKDSENERVYDLEERTAKFGERVIVFTKTLPRNEITRPIMTQLIKSATSIGANYCEADDAESSKDFVHKIGICRKESRESKHWLRMIATAWPELVGQSRVLWSEAKELNLIFNSIARKIKSKHQS